MMLVVTKEMTPGLRLAPRHLNVVLAGGPGQSEAVWHKTTVRAVGHCPHSSLVPNPQQHRCGWLVELMPQTCVAVD